MTTDIQKYRILTRAFSDLDLNQSPRIFSDMFLTYKYHKSIGICGTATNNNINRFFNTTYVPEDDQKKLCLEYSNKSIAVKIYEDDNVIYKTEFKNKQGTEKTFVENETYSITFGDCAENHAGMQKIGETATEGFSKKDVLELFRSLIAKDYSVETILLNKYLPDDGDAEDAYLLVIRNGLDALLGKGEKDMLLTEIKSQREDTMALMRGRVVNKRARWNNCYGDLSQDADIEKGKGTVIDFKDTKEMKKIRELWGKLLGEKGKNLVAETNHYYDLKKCGIGFHGDTERRKVICIRLGGSMPMDFQWFYRHRPVGSRYSLTLHHGDVYIMSEKAVGYDWKKSSIYTLRHAAGAKKYRTTKCE